MNCVFFLRLSFCICRFFHRMFARNRIQLPFCNILPDHMRSFRNRILILFLFCRKNIRKFCSFKYFFQNLCLLLHPVENRNLPVRKSLLMKLTDPLCQILCLDKWIIMIPYQNLLPSFATSLNLSSKLKKTVRRFQDHFIGPVVNRQSQFFCAKSVLDQEEHIRSGSSPAVDHLIRIPHRKKVGLCAF